MKNAQPLNLVLGTKVKKKEKASDDEEAKLPDETDT